MGNTVTGSADYNQVIQEDGVWNGQTQLYLQRYLNCYGSSDLRVNEDGSFGLQSKKELQRFLTQKASCGDIFADGIMCKKTTKAWKKFLVDNSDNAPQPKGDWNESECVKLLQRILNKWTLQCSKDVKVSGSILEVDGKFNDSTQLNFQRYLNHFGPPELKVNEDGIFGKQSRKELQRYLTFMGFGDLIADGSMGEKSTNAWRSWLMFTAPSCDIQPSGNWKNPDAIKALQLILNSWQQRPSKIPSSSLNEVECTVHKLDLSVTKLHHFNYKSWLNQRLHVEKQLETFSEYISKVSKETSIASVVTGSTSILSGTLIVGGILLAPVTAGLSAGMIVAGTAGGIAGGIANLANTLSKFGIETHVQRGMMALMESHQKLTQALIETLETLARIEEQVEQLLRDPVTAPQVINILYRCVKGAYDLSHGLYKGIVQVKNLSYLAAFVCRASKELLDGNGKFICYNMATATAANLGKMISKIVKWGGCKKDSVIAAAKWFKSATRLGSNGAKALSGALAIVGIAFGIWEVIGAASEIKNGSEIAKYFLQAKTSLEKQRINFQEATDNGDFFDRINDG